MISAKAFRPTRGFTLVELLITILIIGMLSVIAVPNYLSARSRGQERSCIANLHSIEGAKEQWAMEKNKVAADVPTPADLVGDSGLEGYIRSYPTCPGGGDYDPGNLVTRPTCTISNHVLH
jgi:prepilin-type N-terminal cleavage/methylation domain-containing protein